MLLRSSFVVVVATTAHHDHHDGHHAKADEEKAEWQYCAADKLADDEERENCRSHRDPVHFIVVHFTPPNLA